MNAVTRQPGEWACLWGVWGLCGALVHMVVRAFFSSSREGRRDARGATGGVCVSCVHACGVCVCVRPEARPPVCHKSL